MRAQWRMLRVVRLVAECGRGRRGGRGFETGDFGGAIGLEKFLDDDLRSGSFVVGKVEWYVGAGDDGFGGWVSSVAYGRSVIADGDVFAV